MLNNKLEVMNGMPPDGLDMFTRGYAECMLWSSTGDNDENLDQNFSFVDFAPETAERIKVDCGQFFEAHLEDLTNVPEGYSFGHGGHDFWLTRCGHGAGFWDGDLPEDMGERLTEASNNFGNVDPYVGDDGLIYFI